MAPTSEHHTGDSAFQLEYKTVLGGAGTLIVLLAGLTWGLFNSSHQDEVDALNRTNSLQWERIRDLNDTVITLRTEQAQHRHYIDDQETRIRALEHRNDRR